VGSMSRSLDALIARFDRLATQVTSLPSLSASQVTSSSSPPVVPPPPPPTSSPAMRSVKLDFPKFNGTDPLYWLFRVEQFFAYYSTPDDQRLIIASVNMEGSIVAWFQMLQRQGLIPTWAALAKAVETQFGPSRFDSPRSRLFKLCQTTTASAYYTDFLVLSTRVEGMSDDAILDCFISGLKPSLRRDIKAHNPQTLIRAAKLARLFEDSDPAESSGPPASSRSWRGSPAALPSPSKFFPGPLRNSNRVLFRAWRVTRQQTAVCKEAATKQPEGWNQNLKQLKPGRNE